MKNFKKLNRKELRTVTGNGLLSDLGGAVGGLTSTVGGAIGGVVGGAVSGVGAVVQNTSTGAEVYLLSIVGGVGM